MTRDEIVKMAREAGLTERNHHSEILVRHSNGSWVDVEHVLWRFAALVAAAEREACSNHYLGVMRRAIEEEREACAQVCEAVDLHNGDHPKNSDPRVTCAAAIRARGNT